MHGAHATRVLIAASAMLTSQFGCEDLVAEGRAPSSTAGASAHGGTPMTAGAGSTAGGAGTESSAKSEAGSTGTAATPVRDGKLGSSCDDDSNCETGLSCISETSGKLLGGSPARGLCTRPCVQGESSCESLGTGAACVYLDRENAYCFESCKAGAALAPKCHLRFDLACSKVYDADELPSPCVNGTCQSGFDCLEGHCFAISTACLPQCNADADCAPGLQRVGRISGSLGDKRPLSGRPRHPGGLRGGRPR